MDDAKFNPFAELERGRADDTLRGCGCDAHVGLVPAACKSTQTSTWHAAVACNLRTLPPKFAGNVQASSGLQVLGEKDEALVRAHTLKKKCQCTAEAACLNGGTPQSLHLARNFSWPAREVQ